MMWKIQRAGCRWTIGPRWDHTMTNTTYIYHDGDYDYDHFHVEDDDDLDDDQNDDPDANDDVAHSCTRFPCYLGMEINAKTQ